MISISSLRVLFASGSLGLGHATRDLAVARELRRKAPSIEIRWLVTSPTSGLLIEAGEVLAPECRLLRCETDTADALGSAGRLSLTSYVYHAMQSWIHNARVIGSAARPGRFDLLVGDETYEVAVAYLLGACALPPIPFVMLWDFWGMDVTTGSPLERLGAWGVNWLWSRQHRVTGRSGQCRTLHRGAGGHRRPPVRHPAPEPAPVC